ncbi:MAG: hypothetical protein A2268_12560 [Candidatus Raymondbacteria bacterium RifOxyA12_full_50_37]|nr:MAG: hypothetical protein A2268_12560 [Candidatus Raymondbacteria bacterium RifOxyA12_full_50_37]OGJ91008.1 MAG: hypothetical protein A2248_00580 [Candidatus Raymondbacteria bacterium RIFOXYA2_FULL_49_16]OGJ97445.1 MAG: hypothetical protein A2453_10130 [Candidatus Raymondbacteria bacterium RIFOXYC2_FULL_50_21]OGP43579.1 MAG: hypothetical protein A2324_13135 [Candidatus Raymondbacteria bacterium RIFOXYB2_FULL_49_35]
MKTIYTLPLILAIAAQALFGQSSLPDSLIADTTLTAAGNPYIISHNVYLRTGIILNIGPGAVFKFTGDYRIKANGVTLNINGTADSMVVFTHITDDSINGDDNNDGDLTHPTIGGIFQGIQLFSSSQVFIKHAHFRFGGSQSYWGGSYYEAMLYIDTPDTASIDSCIFERAGHSNIRLLNCGTGRVQITNSEIKTAVWHGVYAHSASRPYIAGCWIHDNGRYGVAIGADAGTDNSNAVLGDTAVSGSGGNRIHTNNSGNINTAILNGATTNPVKAMSNYWCAPDTANRNIYWINATLKGNATYYANPTADPDTICPDPISSLIATPTSSGFTLTWIAPDQDSTPASGDPVYLYQVRWDTIPIAIFDSARFSTNKYLGALPGQPETFEAVTVKGDTYYVAVRPVDGYANTGPVSYDTVVTTMGAGTVISGSLRSPKNVTWDSAGSPYILTGDFYIQDTVRLTIGPGVVVRMNNANYDFLVHGSLIARGTKEKPVVFTSENPTDGAGAWQGITISSTAKACTLINVTIEKGGKNDSYDYGCLMVDNTAESLYVDSCTIRYSATFGMRLHRTRGGVIKNTRIEYCTGAAITMNFYCATAFSNISIYDCGWKGYFIQSLYGNGYHTDGNNITFADSVNKYWFYGNTYDFFIDAGDTFTAAPGVCMEVTRSTYETEFQVNGVVLAQGTKDQPIRWESVYASGQFDKDSTWRSIQLNNVTDTSRFRHVIFSEAEISQSAGGVLTCNGASPLIDSCAFTNNWAYAIWVNANNSTAAKPRITNCSFSNNMFGCVYIVNTTVLQPDPIFRNNTAVNNGNNGIQMDLTNDLSQDAVWEADSMWYLIKELDNTTPDFEVGAGNRLTIEAGTKLRFFDPAQDLRVYGELRVNGTTVSPVVLTGPAQTPGSWGGIEFASGSNRNSYIKNAAVAYAGGNSNGAAIEINNCEPAFDSVHVLQSANDGFQIAGNAKVEIRNCLMEGCSTGIKIAELTSADSLFNNVFLDAALSLVDFPAPNPPYMTGNRDSSGAKGTITMRGGNTLAASSLAGSLTLDSVYNWRISNGANGYLTIPAAATLTVQPGTRVEIAGGYAQSDIRVRGTLQAMGTAADSIIFTATADTSGSWQGISFFDASTGSTLRYCGILNAGGSTGKGAIHLETGSATIDRCRIFKSKREGITVKGKIDTLVSATIVRTVFDSVAGGIAIQTKYSNDSLGGNLFRACSTRAISFPSCNFPRLTANRDSSGTGIWVVGSDYDSLARIAPDTVTLDSQYAWNFDLKDSKILIDTHQVLNIRPNTRIGMYVDNANDDGAVEIRGILNAVGTATKPIEFYGIDTTYHWAGFVFRNDSSKTDSSRLEYVSISDAGDWASGYEAMVQIYTNKLIFRNNTLSNPQKIGLLVSDTVYPVIGSLHFDSTFDTSKVAAMVLTYPYDNSPGDSLPLTIANTFWGDSTGPYDPSLTGGFYSVNYATAASDTLQLANFGMGGKIGRWINYVPFVSTDKLGPRVDSIRFANARIGASGHLSFSVYVNDRSTGVSNVDDALYAHATGLDTASGFGFDSGEPLGSDSTIMVYTKAINVLQLTNPKTDTGYIVGEDTLWVYAFGRDEHGFWGAIDSAFLRLQWAPDTLAPRAVVSTIPDSLVFMRDSLGDSITVNVLFDDETGHTLDQRSDIYSYTVSIDYWYKYNAASQYWYGYTSYGSYYDGQFNADTSIYRFSFKLSADTSNYYLRNPDTTGKYGYRIRTQVQDAAYHTRYDTTIVYIGERTGGADTSFNGPELAYKTAPQIATSDSATLTFSVTYSTFATSASPIVYAEYFIDSLGVLNSGTPINVPTDSIIVTLVFQVPVDTAWPSFSSHTVFLAVLDSAGNWSHVDSLSFLKVDSVVAIDTATVSSSAIDTVDFGGVKLVISDTAQFTNPQQQTVSTLPITVTTLAQGQDFGIMDSTLVKLGPIYVFSPSGAEFKGLQLAIPYDTILTRTASVGSGKICILTYTGSRWAIVSTTYRPVPSPAAGLVYNLVEHFSFYRVVADTTRPTVARTTATTNYTEGSTVQLTADISDNIFVAAANIECQYRQGGEITPTPISVSTNTSDPSKITATVAFNRVLSRESGLQYRFIATDFLGNTDTSAYYSIDVTYANATSMPILPEETYRIVAFPFAMSSKTVSNVLYPSILGNANAPYNDSLFRIFKYEGKTGSTPGEFYTEMTDADMEIERGEGYVAITRLNYIGAPNTIILGNGNITAKALDVPFKIPLRSGWNLVGNPFNLGTGLEWLSLASDAGGLGDSLTWYRLTGARTSVRFDTVSTVDHDSMGAMQGYFVFNAGAPDTLIVPASVEFSTTVPKAAIATDTLAKFNWAISLEINDGSKRSETITLGARSTASDGYDRNDNIHPPSLMETRFACVPRTTWKTASGSYRADFTCLFEDGRTWPLTMRSLDKKRNVSIHLAAIENMPQGFMTVLYDPERMVGVDLQTDSAYDDLLAKNGSKNYEVVVGAHDYVQNRLNGKIGRPEFFLAQNTPNPFNPITAIHYALKRDTRIDLSIFNIRGQLVRTLVQGKMRFGRYVALWDGRDNTGKAVASGMYVYRLVSPEFVCKKKMVIVK